jgi:hypothetical protein
LFPGYLLELSYAGKENNEESDHAPEGGHPRFGGVDYFDVSTDGDCIVLRPLRASRAGEVRERLAGMGITENDVRDAADWARDHP